MKEEILRIERVLSLRDSLDSVGKKLVLTNGCFDILHAGHVRYLTEARKLGGALVVAVNSDRSVRALKGESRPINNQDDRAEVIAALKPVDQVIIFDDLRVDQVIREIRPHIWVKGGDVSIGSLPQNEKQALEDCQVEIKILPFLEGRSTTGVIEKIQSR